MKFLQRLLTRKDLLKGKYLTPMKKKLSLLLRPLHIDVQSLLEDFRLEISGEEHAVTLINDELRYHVFMNDTHYLKVVYLHENETTRTLQTKHDGLMRWFIKEQKRKVMPTLAIYDEPPTMQQEGLNRLYEALFSGPHALNTFQLPKQKTH